MQDASPVATHVAKLIRPAETTVRFHTRNILDTQHAENRTQAAVWAARLRLAPDRVDPE